MIKDVDGHPDRCVQPLGRADEARRAHRLSPYPGHYGKPLQAVREVRPVSRFPGEGYPFLQVTYGAVVVAAGEGHLRQVVKRDVGAQPVAESPGHRQFHLKHMCGPAQVTARQRCHPQIRGHVGHAVILVDFAEGSQGLLEVGRGRLMIGPAHRHQAQAEPRAARHELIPYPPGQLQAFFETPLETFVVTVGQNESAGDHERLRSPSQQKVAPEQHRLHPPAPLDVGTALPPELIYRPTHACGDLGIAPERARSIAARGCRFPSPASIATPPGQVRAAGALRAQPDRLEHPVARHVDAVHARVVGRH